MEKLEQGFITKLKKWMVYNVPEIQTYGWEAKYPRSREYKFSQDKSFAKELQNLHIWYNKFIYKFSDITQMGTPHDGFTGHGKGYFFFTWDGKKFYMIEVTDIKNLVDSGVPGLDENMASVIAYKIDSVK